MLSKSGFPTIVSFLDPFENRVLRSLSAPAESAGLDPMVFFNYATMQMAAKIVYYGPGLCGKTTNLHWIYGKTSPQSRGEMVSLETETDRTLFFDLLPIDVGVIGGFKTRLQLYTIPGQVFYNTTRKLVLKGVDGIVFVADSQTPMLDANVESIKNLRENLAEIGLNLDEIPTVIQLNKRDLPNILDKNTILSALDPQGIYEHTEASAVGGMGVFETLKLISKLTLRTLRRRMTGDDARSPTARRPPENSFRARVPEPLRPPRPVEFYDPNAPDASDEELGAAMTILEPPPPPMPDRPFKESSELEAVRSEAPASIATVDAPAVTPVPASAAIPDSTAEDVIFDAAILEDVPIPSAELPHQAAPAPILKAPEQEIDFGRADKAPRTEEPQVKRVKVRNSVDVMAELEALRKRATQTTPKVRRETPAPTPVQTPGKSIERSLSLAAGTDWLGRSRIARVTLSLEDENAGVLHRYEQTIDLDDADGAQSILLNLKIDAQ
jgi:signal recognition particle receptor subunit beta